MYHFDLCLFCIIAAIINTVDNKRLDIEEECRNEYGLDLKSLLRQFRRSDDYVKILKLRTNEFNVFFADVATHSLDWHYHKMKAEIQATYGLNKSVNPPEIQTTTLKTEAKARMLASKLSGRRQGSEKGLGKAMRAIKHIDEHPKLSSHLTVAERNYFKSLAFEYAGETIHTAIKAFGAEPSEGHGSTQLNFQGIYASTTQHALRHIAGAKKLLMQASTKSESGKQNTVSKRYLLVSKKYPLLLRDGY